MSDQMKIFDEIKKHELSFPQLLEVTAHIFYKSLLKESVPKYVSMFNEEEKTMDIVTMGQVRYKEWNDKQFCLNFDLMLMQCGIFLGHSTLYPDGTIITFLIDENKEPLIKRKNE